MTIKMRAFTLAIRRHPPISSGYLITLKFRPPPVPGAAQRLRLPWGRKVALCCVCGAGWRRAVTIYRASAKRIFHLSSLPPAAPGTGQRGPRGATPRRLYLRTHALRPSPERRQRRSGGRRLAAIPLDTTVYSSAATRTIIQMPAASAPACSSVSAGVDFAASTAGRMSTAAT